MLSKFFGQHTWHGSLSKFTQFWSSKVPNSKSLHPSFTNLCLDPFFQKMLISPKVLAVWLHLNRPKPKPFLQDLDIYMGAYWLQLWGAPFVPRLDEDQYVFLWFWLVNTWSWLLCSMDGHFISRIGQWILISFCDIFLLPPSQIISRLNFLTPSLTTHLI